MLELKNITKDYVSGDLVVHALKGISLTLRDSEFVSILGPSGCGKTTTLNIIGGLDRYTDGDMLIEGVSTKEFKDHNWDQYRNHKVGFVFQSYNLIPHQTVLSNVMLALTIGGVDKKKKEELAKEALIKVGLEEEFNKFPKQLSGGQMQRVAIARALVNKPQVLLADEPTGALDSKTSIQVLELLKELSKDCLVVMVTHNEELAKAYSTRIISLKDGEMVGDTNPYDPTQVEIEASKAKEVENNKQFLDKKGKLKKVKMPFFTALKLSLSNLKSKIGRTILTCFAGSIGIIGIALILSVSNGFNKFVKQTETSTLSQYPVELSTQSLDMTSLFLSFMSQNRRKTSQDIKNRNDYITPNYVMIQLLESVANSSRTNDLRQFKAYLDLHYDEIKPYVNYIQYNYGTKLRAYDSKRIDSNGNFVVRQLEPFTLPQSDPSDPYYVYTKSFGKETMESYMRSLGVWDEVYGDDQGLVSETIKKQYDLVAGNWPTEYNEVLVVLDEVNQLSDFVLYAIGLADDENGVDVGDQYVLDMFDYVNGKTYVDENGVTQKCPNPKDNPKYQELFKWSYEEILDKVGFYILPDSQAYAYDSKATTDDGKEFNTYTNIRYNDAKLAELFNSDQAIKIKVSGVIRPNEKSDAHSINGSIAYTSTLLNQIMDINNSSQLIKDQIANPEYTVTDIYYSTFKVGSAGEKFSDIKDYAKNMLGLDDQIVNAYFGEEYLYNENLKSFGYVDETNPKSIKIYPKSFEDKDKIDQFIENYNATKESDDDKIAYTDYVKTLMGSVTTIVNAITYVLIAFVSISLIVSSIMIAIITYISVLERTKEIGILRAMGASKVDVSNIFNAETFITGLISGILGVLITLILNIPISLIIKHLSDISNIATLPPLGGVALVAVSFLLSVISGLIPSTFASKCDPVVALRSE